MCSARVRRSVGAAVLAAGVACAACTGPSGSSLEPSPQQRSGTTPTAQAGASHCDHDEIRGAVEGFVDSWNNHDVPALRGLFVNGAELDMSTKNQRAQSPSTHNGYRTVSGWNAIERFVAAQWRLGEVLHYQGVQLFADGAYARGMTATFNDGSTQSFGEAKFAVDCSVGSFDHVEIVSTDRAS